MKHLHILLITTACISLYASDTIDPKEWEAFQQKYPVITAIVQHNEDVVHELARNVRYKQFHAEKLAYQIPNAVQEKIKKNAIATQNAATLIPVMALAGVGVRSIDWKPLLQELTKKLLINASIGITCNVIENGFLPKSMQKYTSAQLSGYGLTVHVDIRDALQAYEQHIEKNGLMPSAKYAALLAGMCVANIHKSESTHVLRLPGTELIILRDNQAIDISTRSAGHLIAQGEIPIKEEVAYQIAKNTVIELSYNTFAQLLHKVAQEFEIEKYLEPFIPQDCNPKNTYQYGVKMGINLLTYLGISFMFRYDLAKIDLDGLDNILGVRYDT